MAAAANGASEWAERILALSRGDLTVLAAMVDASETARNEALDRLREAREQTRAELAGLRRQLAEAHQRISDLEAELERTPAPWQ